MLKRCYNDITAQNAGEGSHNASMRVLIGELEGASHFIMRMFELGPGGRTPHHAHEWEHEIFVLNGTGKLIGDGGTIPFAAGDALYIPGGELHHLENTASNLLKFLCLIPKISPSGCGNNSQTGKCSG